MHQHHLSGIRGGIGIFHAAFDDPILSEVVSADGDTAWVIVDEAVKDHAATYRIIAQLGDRNILVTPIPGGEQSKDSVFYGSLCTQALDHFQRAPSILIAIGGGTILNLCTFIAASLEDGGIFIPPHKTYAQLNVASIRKLVVVPTTILSVADVAYGSKGNINTKSEKSHPLMDIFDAAHGKNRAGERVQKHGWKLYRDPDEIYVDPDYIKTLPPGEIKRGLSEVLKHALLQDDGGYIGAPLKTLLRDPVETWRGTRWRFAPSLDITLAQMRSGKPDPAACLWLALQTMYVKAGMLGVDKSEERWPAALLSYGHLHAHAMEMASDYKIGHAEAVYVGMLIDLKLAGSVRDYQRILSVSPYLPVARDIQKLDISVDVLKEAYAREPKDFFRNRETGLFKVLPLKQKGLYSTPYASFDIDRPSPMVEFSFDTIMLAWKDVVADLKKEVTGKPSFVQSAKRVLGL